MLPISIRNLFIISLLVIAACLSGWSIILSKQSQTPVIKKASNKPDAFMEGVKATIMSKAGKPTLKVEAPTLVHFTENDATELTHPHVIIYRESPEPWHINSNFAKTKQGIQEITFWQNVVIHHLADTKDPITTFKTTTLTVLPDQQLVKTSEAIEMTQPASIIHAVGMLANWNLGTVQLLSQAREEYVPNS